MISASDAACDEVRPGDVYLASMNSSSTGTSSGSAGAAATRAGRAIPAARIKGRAAGTAVADLTSSPSASTAENLVGRCCALGSPEEVIDVSSEPCCGGLNPVGSCPAIVWPSNRL